MTLEPNGTGGLNATLAREESNADLPDELRALLAKADIVMVAIVYRVPGTDQDYTVTQFNQ